MRGRVEGGERGRVGGSRRCNGEKGGKEGVSEGRRVGEKRNRLIEGDRICAIEERDGQR